MSYLSTPRLVFAGQFLADPSTVNNDPEHFDPATFRPEYQRFGQGASNGWWNPGGKGAWGLRGCTVRRVVYRDGSTCDDPEADPVVGLAVTGDESGTEAKIVDLDPEQQSVSELWGFKVLLGGSGGRIGFRGDFKVAPFGDLWIRYGAGRPDSFFGAFYQSVLESVRWSGDGGSEFLKELMAGGSPTELSIKFNVDGFHDDPSDPSTFTLGRVVGSIGLRGPGEPAFFVAGRALQAPVLPGTTIAMVRAPAINTVYAQVEGDAVTVDLGNSLPTSSMGGPLADSGNLALAFLPATGPPVRVGAIDYSGPGWYEQTAGIVRLGLTADQAVLAPDTRLAIVQEGPSGSTPLIAEAPDGTWLRADAFVFRLNPGESAETTLHATGFGKPLAGAKISLGYDATVMAPQTYQGAIPGPSVVGEPQSALTFPPSVTTGPDGTASVTLRAGDPGNPRSYIDGQLYGVNYAPGDWPPFLGQVTNSNQILSVLVWSGYRAPEQPDWVHDVGPILTQYANLYPVMKQFVDLSSYGSVVENKASLRYVLGVPVSDPISMPVTRDLSAAKRAMILRWLADPIESRPGTAKAE